MGGSAVAVRVGVRVAVGGTPVAVRVGVAVGAEPWTVTVVFPPRPEIEVGPTAGGPGWKALTRLEAAAESAALPEPIAVNDSTATPTLPVGPLEEVCDATTVTAPFAFAVAGDV